MAVTPTSTVTPRLRDYSIADCDGDRSFIVGRGNGGFRLRITPQAPGAGDIVEVVGEGLPAGEYDITISPVIVTMDARVLGRVTVGADGRFTTTVQMVSVWPPDPTIPPPKLSSWPPGSCLHIRVLTKGAWFDRYDSAPFFVAP